MRPLSDALSFIDVAYLYDDGTENQISATRRYRCDFVHLKTGDVVWPLCRVRPGCKLRVASESVSSSS